MSTCYRYNGTVLPALPATDYPYRVIVHGQDTDGNTLYMLWLCDRPFTKESDTVFSYPVDAAVAGYGANMSTYKWYAGTIQKDEGDADYYVMNGTFVWCDHDIYSRANPTQKAHAATEPEAITVQAPASITVTGGGTYDQGAAAGALTCTATSPDGGALSYKWYRDGAVCGYAAAYVPSTKTAGTFLYYCIVTNTLYGDKVTAQSDTITVTVNAVETEEVTVRKPKEVIGYALKVCGVPMAELIAEMLCKEAVATATQYIYGVPSESGNIGLRSGDSVVYYDGVVAPVSPDYDTTANPYVVIRGYDTGTYVLTADDEPFIIAVDGAVGTLFPNVKYDLTDGAWQERSIGTLGGAPVWSNHDMYYVDSEAAGELAGTLGHAKSNPIPVSGIVAYSYNGTVLPALPDEGYKYAFIYPKYSYGIHTYHLYLFSEIKYGSDGNGKWCVGKEGSSVSYFYTVETPENGWAHRGYWETSALICNVDNLMWANFDVLNEEGTVYLPANSPVPVYE